MKGVLESVCEEAQDRPPKARSEANQGKEGERPEQQHFKT